jgi:hypothetical protein
MKKTVPFLIVTLLIVSLWGTESKAVQNYDQDLLELRSQLSTLNNELNQLKREQSAVAFMAEQLRINGYSRVTLKKLRIDGAGKDAGLDFLGRPLWYDPVENKAQTAGSKSNQIMKMSLVGKVVPQIEVGTDLVATLTWAGSSSFRTENVAIRANLNQLSMNVGTYWAHLTPLTLYYAQSAPQYESPLFSVQRTDNDLWQNIVGSNRKLEGLKGEYAIEDLKLTGLVARVSSDPADRFLKAAGLNLAPHSAFNLGLNWLQLTDEPAPLAQPRLASELLGVTGLLKIRPHVIFKSEYVAGDFDNDVNSGLVNIRDAAIVTELQWSSGKLNGQVQKIKIGPSYYAPTAQSRDHTLKDLSVFGSSIATTATDQSMTEALNEVFPYGLATPNRSGSRLKLDYPFADRASLAFELARMSEIRPVNELDKLTAKIDVLRKFTNYSLGFKADLASWLKRIKQPLVISGQITRAKTTRPSAVNPETSAALHEISIENSLFDLAVNYQLRPNYQLLVGMKTDYKVGHSGKAFVDTRQADLRAGLRLQISDQTDTLISYGITNFTDADASNNFKGDSADIVFRTFF